MGFDAPISLLRSKSAGRSAVWRGRTASWRVGGVGQYGSTAPHQGVEISDLEFAGSSVSAGEHPIRDRRKTDGARAGGIGERELVLRAHCAPVGGRFIILWGAT